MGVKSKRRRPSKSTRAARLTSWLRKGMPREGTPPPTRRVGPGPAMRVAFFYFAAPRRGASIDGEDMNAFLYTLALHQAKLGAELHYTDGVGGRFSVAFTHPHPSAFLAAVAEDLSGYFRARHGWTGPVLEPPTLVSLFGADEQTAALTGLHTRAVRLLLGAEGYEIDHEPVEMSFGEDHQESIFARQLKPCGAG